jgi:hypothetical protein
MCTGLEGFVVPAILAAVGTAATVVNQRNVAHQQDQTLAAQIRAQGQKQQQADARTSQLINQEATSTDTQDKAKSQAAYAKQLAQHAPQATEALNAPPSASQAFAKSKQDAALGVADYGNQQADWLSSIAAPTLQRQRDVRENIDPYKTDIGLISRANAGDNFLSNMRLRNIQPNPWLSLVSGVAGGASTAMAKGGYGSDAGTGAPYTAYNGQYGDLPDVTGIFKPPPSNFSYYPSQ